MTQELHGVISLGGTVIGGSLYQRGLKGETGVGIESVVMTGNYDLIITYTDESVETVPTGLDTYKALLEGYKSETYSYMQGAVNSASSAYSSAQSASGSATDAGTYAGQAYNYATSAQTAKTAAETAQGKAEDAQDAAETAQGKAEDAQDAAETAQGKAEDAQEAAETAATNANTYQGWAQDYANNAQTQAGYANTYKQAAYDSQVAAAASALVSEGYANGEQNGTPVTSGSPYYHNNAKYYSEQFIRAFPTDTASGAIASFEDGSDLFDYLSCVINIEPVQAGSGTPSPDNVRPITGWTGCEVDVSGVNVWDEEWELGTIDNLGNDYASTTRIRSKGHTSVLSSTTYYLKSALSTQLFYYDADKTFISAQFKTDATFTTPSNAHYIRLSFNSTYGTTYNNDVSINYPSTDTTYHAYNGTTYPVSWQTEAGTVYGGTVDLVTGVLTVDRKFVNIDPSTVNINAVVTGGGRYIVTTTDAKDVQTSDPIAYTICNTLKAITSDSIEIGGSSLISSKRLSFMLPVSTRAEARQWFTDNPTTVVYPLATPQTYQLDPVQVACLLGQNNVWAGCGDIDEVKYKADVQLWVEKQLREINTAILALS